MVKIINPFSGQDPIASMFSRLGGQLSGQRESALAIEKAREAQRQNVEIEGLAADIAAGRIDPKDPRIAARLMLSGYDPSNYSVIGGMTTDPHSDMATRMLSATGHYRDTANIVDQNIQIAKEQEAAKLAETGRAHDLEHGDRRYNSDIDLGEKQREFTLNLGETGRAHDLEQAARLEAQKNEMLKFAMEPKPAMINAPAAPPVLGPGGAPIAAGAPGAPHPGFVPQGELATRPDVAPILSETDVKGSLGAANFGRMGDLPPNEQSYLGADVDPARTGGPTWMYVAGGKSFMVNDASIAQGKDVRGDPVPPGGTKVSLQPTEAGGAGLTNATQSEVQKSIISHQQFDSLLDYAEKQVLSSPPENFGIVGLAKDVGQSAAIAADNLAQGLGFRGANDALNAVQAEAIQNGVSPGILASIFTFDPRLGQLQTTYGLLVYAAASALAGQQNRSVSDTDVVRAKEIVGNPQGLFSNQQLMLAKIKTLRDLSRMQSDVNQRALGGPGAPAAPKRRTATDAAGNKVEYDPVAKAWVPAGAP